MLPAQALLGVFSSPRKQLRTADRSPKLGADPTEWNEAQACARGMFVFVSVGISDICVGEYLKYTKYHYLLVEGCFEQIYFVVQSIRLDWTKVLTCFFPALSSFQIASPVGQKHNFLQLIMNPEKLACHDERLQCLGANCSFSKTFFLKELHFQSTAKVQQEYGCKETKGPSMWTWSFPASPETSETDPQVYKDSSLSSAGVDSRWCILFSTLKIPSEDIYTSDSDLFPLSGPWVATGWRTKDKSGLFFLTGNSRTEQHLSSLIHYPPLHLA